MFDINVAAGINYASIAVNIIYLIKYMKLGAFAVTLMPLSIVDLVDSAYATSIKQYYMPILLSDAKVFIDFEVLPLAVTDIFTSLNFSGLFGYFVSVLVTVVCYAPDIFELVLVNNYDPSAFNQNDPTLRAVFLYIPLFIKGLGSVLEAGNLYLGLIV